MNSNINNKDNNNSNNNKNKSNNFNINSIDFTKIGHHLFLHSKSAPAWSHFYSLKVTSVTNVCLSWNFQLGSSLQKTYEYMFYLQ